MITIPTRDAERYSELYQMGAWLYGELEPAIGEWGTKIRNGRELYRREVDFIELCVALGLAKEYMEDNR